ncbi:MAG: type II toxin-antitoxin system prevent-host-death family antitoxin [Spirochaetia bacterium]|jgi:prevent-host-death family protein|nr:type II toxin-antitoxin system prevent-host-death family antitoxin [Spirochaetia bacterium]
MQATSKDLRFHTKEILDTALRGEEVIITYHGKPYVKISPIVQSNPENKNNAFCGMWKDRTDMNDVTAYVRKLRKGRQF